MVACSRIREEMAIAVSAADYARLDALPLDLLPDAAALHMVIGETYAPKKA